MSTKIVPRTHVKRASRDFSNSLFVVFSSLGIVFLTGCANVIPPCNAKNSPPSSELRNTKWELTRWNLAPNSSGEVRTRQIPQGEASNPIHISFDTNGQRVSGSTGCNRFTAQLDEDPRGFTITKIVSTKMACTPIGSVCPPGSVTQSVCPSGTYSSDSATTATACLQCAAGKSSYAGAGVCCSANFYAVPGATACTDGGGPRICAFFAFF